MTHAVNSPVAVIRVLGGTLLRKTSRKKQPFQGISESMTARVADIHDYAPVKAVNGGVRSGTAARSNDCTVTGAPLCEQNHKRRGHDCCQSVNYITSREVDPSVLG